MLKRTFALLGTCLIVGLLAMSPQARAQAVTSGAEQPDKTFWLTIKDTSLPDLFEMFIKRYPQSEHRVDAERKLLALQSGSSVSALDQARQLTKAAQPESKPITRSIALPTVPVTAKATTAPAKTVAARQNAPAEQAPETSSSDASELALMIQFQLQRVGYDIGRLDGKWGGRSRAAATDFTNKMGLDLDTDNPNSALLTVLKASKANSVLRQVRKDKPKAKKAVKKRKTYRKLKRKSTKKKRVKRSGKKRKVYSKAKRKKAASRKKVTRKKLKKKRKVVKKKAKKKKVLKKKVVKKVKKKKAKKKVAKVTYVKKKKKSTKPDWKNSVGFGTGDGGGSGGGGGGGGGW